MTKIQNNPIRIETIEDFAALADYSLIDTLNPDPEATADGVDHDPRQVFSGHYVPVNPTPIDKPHYIAHSETFFDELGLDDSLAKSEEFMKMFSGDLSSVPKPLKTHGWATGYALSIYGREYYQQCPFQTGNGYGDGRAVSIFEGVVNGRRLEMQLKGGGRTPYCRGADGRAVLRSSVREFLAQELMNALGVPTSRSLTFYTSRTETVRRPWFNEGSYSKDPEIMIEEMVAISTRVASSFLRIGQIELFGRRARKNEHPKALEELEKIVVHAIDREYSNEINTNLALDEKVLLFAEKFRDRLISLVTNWIRVGFCQGNFNSDNTAIGGYTLDYGPFGFIDAFDPKYQPWTGGGAHFSFLNQPQAALRNFHMLITALQPLIVGDRDSLNKLDAIENEFPKLMQQSVEKMWADKLGLDSFNLPLFNELIIMMQESLVDYTIMFRELSNIPESFESLKKAFYDDYIDPKTQEKWSAWLEQWKVSLNISSNEEKEKLSEKMKLVNPKYTLREWILVPAYEAAQKGDYTLVKELQKIMIDPYREQSKEIEEKYYRGKPSHYFNVAGISHITCSS